ncbi:MAG: DUF2905 family protein [Acetobacteraceae bacterium]|nr:DUF2905 family protein [Acetobacteraceae bacterium]
MPGLAGVGRLLLVAGLVLAGLGLLLLLGGRFLGLGRLPGDIYVQRGNFTLYFPLVSGLVLSLVLSLVLTLVFWLLRR